MSMPHVRVALTFTILATLACENSDPVAPQRLLSARVSQSHLIGDAAPYSGVLTPGIFTVCTSRFSPPGVYEYTIDAPAKSMKAVKSITMGPGECRIVAELKQNWNPDLPAGVVVVNAVSSFVPDGLVVIDGSCSLVCESLGPPPTSALLYGPAGAVAKFYFFNPDSFASGGHGGTGTITFAAD